MNKRQRTAIERTIARLKDKHLGAYLSAISPGQDELNKAVETLQAHGYEVASRLYLETWVIPALELALSSAADDQHLAVRLSRR